ncbi:hypothetical protein BURMUCF2_B0533 [Burkholderia multivorans CF2]|nr:hypothetical protein BURMUCF2_B0533 [Burkholderia multivorans CF2]
MRVRVLRFDGVVWTARRRSTKFGRRSVGRVTHCNTDRRNFVLGSAIGVFQKTCPKRMNQ